MRAAVRVLDAFCLLTLLTLISALFFDVSILNSMNALSRAGSNVEQQYYASFLRTETCTRVKTVASVGYTCTFCHIAFIAKLTGDEKPRCFHLNIDSHSHPLCSSMLCLIQIYLVLSRAGCDAGLSGQVCDAALLGTATVRYGADAANCARCDAVASVGDTGTTSRSLCATRHD